MAHRPRERPDARLLLAGGKAGSGGDGAGAGARRPASTTSTIFAGERPAAEIPAYLLRVRRARVAAVARHEHAAEDLSVSAIGQADRGHAAADAHAGAERRHRDSHRRDARGVRATAFWRRCSDPARAAAVGARARELAETKYSYEAYLERTRQACAALLAGPPRRAAAPVRRRTSREPSALRDHYSYTRLCRPGDRASVRRSGASAGRSASWSRRQQARVLIELRSARSGIATILDVGTGTGRAALLLARGGARVTGVDASEEMLAIARTRGRRGIAVDPFLPRRRARARVPRSRVRRRRQPARADARAATGAVRRPSCAASSDRLVISTIPSAAQRRAVPGRRPPRRLHRFGARTEPYRVLQRPDGRARAAERRLPGPCRSIGSSSCRLRCTKRSDRGASRSASRALSGDSGCCACSDRRSRSLPNGAQFSSPAPPGSPAAIWRARSRPQATRCARWSAIAGRTAPAGSRIRTIRSTRVRRSARRRSRRSGGRGRRGGVSTSRRIYRQAGLADRDISRRQRHRRRRARRAGGPAPACAASCTAARSASTATSSIRRPNEDAPLRPGDVYQRTKVEGEERARAAGGAVRHRGHDCRPSGIYGPGDRRLLKLFRKHRAPLSDPRAAEKSITISPTSTIWSKAFGSAASTRRRPIAPTSWPAVR